MANIDKNIYIDRYEDEYEGDINLPDGIENLSWEEITAVIERVCRDQICIAMVDGPRLAMMLKQMRNNYIASRERTTGILSAKYKSYVDMKTFLLYTCSDEEAEQIVADSKCDPKRVMFSKYSTLRARRK